MVLTECISAQLRKNYIDTCTSISSGYHPSRVTGNIQTIDGLTQAIDDVDSHHHLLLQKWTQ